MGAITCKEDAYTFLESEYDINDGDAYWEEMHEAVTEQEEKLDTALQKGNEWGYVKDVENMYPRGEPIAHAIGSGGYGLISAGTVMEHQQEIFDAAFQLDTDGIAVATAATAVVLAGLSVGARSKTKSRYDTLEEERDVYRECLDEIESTHL